MASASDSIYPKGVLPPSSILGRAYSVTTPDFKRARCHYSTQGSGEKQDDILDGINDFQRHKEHMLVTRGSQRRQQQHFRLSFSNSLCIGYVVFCYVYVSARAHKHSCTHMYAQK